MTHKDAFRLFFHREGVELMGHRGGNVAILFAIFLLSILAISFSSANMDFLKYKMDDPFINWVDIVYSQKTSHNATTPLKDFLTDTDIQSRYLFTQPQPCYTLSRDFRKAASDDDIQLDGRSISAFSTIMDRILSNDNIVERRELPISDDELSLIMTREALTRLGYSSNSYPAFVKMSLPYDTADCHRLQLGYGYKGYYAVNIPIAAIVDQLPGMYSYIFTSRLQNEYYTSHGITLDITAEDNNQSLELCGTDANIAKAEEYIKREYGTANISRSEYNQSWHTISRLIIDQFSDISWLNNEERIVRYNLICNNLNERGINVDRLYNFVSPTSVGNYTPNYYSVQMTSLDSIRSFSTALFKKCGIKLEMTSIDAKDNFNIIQRMAYILSSAIVGLSGIFVMILLYFLLTSHFDKIRKNLGTFKAFGLSGKFLKRLYITLILSIITISFGAAVVVAYLIAWLSSLVWGFAPDYPYLDVINIFNLILFVVSVVGAVFIATFVTQRKLSRTPGNLIYNR